MRRFRVTLFAALMACSASAAWAQYGLYGSPDVLPLPQQSIAPIDHDSTGYVTATGYRATTVAVQPAPPPPMPGGAPMPQGAGTLKLTEQSCYGGSGAYSGSMNRFDQAACGACGDGCGCGGYGPDCCCKWYATVDALVMGRGDARRVWTSFEDGVETNQLTNTQFGMPWGWGGEVTLGYRFCCCCVPYAIEATYWTTQPSSNCEVTTVPGGYVSTPLEVDPMTFGVAGPPARDWFFGAQEQRLWRKDEFHNIEINLVRQQLPCCGSCWDANWLVGFRYFRFQEDLTFGSLRGGATAWGENGGADEAYISDNITNNLFGVQLGFEVGYNVACGLRFFIEPKIGIYDNYLDGTFQARTGNGIDGVGPYGSFPVHSTRNGLAFLSQIDLGAEWRFSQHWSARAGYRVLAITGTGLADDQIPQYIVDMPEIANIQHTSSLVLHGAFAGLTYCF
jgi:hypothetical protein